MRHHNRDVTSRSNERHSVNRVFHNDNYVLAATRFISSKSQHYVENHYKCADVTVASSTYNRLGCSHSNCTLVGSAWLLGWYYVCSMISPTPSAGTGSVIEYNTNNADGASSSFVNFRLSWPDAPRCNLSQMIDNNNSQSRSSTAAFRPTRYPSRWSTVYLSLLEAPEIHLSAGSTCLANSSPAALFLTCRSKKPPQEQRHQQRQERQRQWEAAMAAAATVFGCTQSLDRPTSTESCK